MLKAVPMVVLLLVVGISPSRARDFSWNFRNSTGVTLNLQLYSQKRSLVWPTGESFWIIPPNGLDYSNHISCSPGEYICYGAWPADGTERHWGLGKGGTERCATCCYYCRGGGTSLINMTP